MMGKKFPDRLYVRKYVGEKETVYLADPVLVSDEECFVAVYELKSVKRMQIRKTLVDVAPIHSDV